MRLVLMQTVLQLDFTQLLTIPVLIVAGIYGWKRGWREEALTSVGLILALLLFSNETVATNIASIINRIVSAFGLFLNVLLGGEQTEANPLITANNFSTFQIIAFTVAAGLSYIVGGALGRRQNVGKAGKALGVLIGTFNAYLIMTRVIEFLTGLQRKNGDVPIPFGLDNGAQINIMPMTQSNGLRANLPIIFALLFLVIMVITFFRLPKIRQ